MAQNGAGNGAAAPKVNGAAYPLIDHTFDVVVVGEPSIGADGGRFAHERVCAHDHAGVRILGRQLDLREPGLQAPDERVAHRQAHHGKESAHRRGNLGLAQTAARHLVMVQVSIRGTAS